MPPKKMLRIGVIGIGSMGQNHLRVYSQMDGVILTAMADPDSTLLNSSLHRYPGIIPYKNYQEMITKENLDIISIVVPTRIHSRVALDVIKKGIHVLIEKPLALTVDECRNIIRLAKKFNITLGVGHIERFNPVITTLKTHLDDGKLGRVFQIVIRRVGPYPGRIQDVGVLLDLATHDIDVMHYLTGVQIKDLNSQTGKQLDSNHEDLAVSTLRFENGIVGILIENWLSPTKIRDVTINGEKGMYIANFITQDLYFYENNYQPSSWESIQVFRGMAEGNMIRFAIDKKEPLQVELNSFVNSVRMKKKFLVSGEEGMYAVDIANKLLKSSV